MKKIANKILFFLTVAFGMLFGYLEGKSHVKC